MQYFLSITSLVVCTVYIQGALAAVAGTFPPRNALKSFSGNGVNLWKSRQQQIHQLQRNFQLREFNTSSVSESFPTQWFTQPLDHFVKNSPTFGQRYWVNSRHYIPGPGRPVIVIDGGETSGEDRLGFLDTGIADILAKATGGVGVVLEHRYYGQSVPVENFTTDSLRWLNNEQALEDSANFLANVNFSGAGIQEDLRAPKTPWIYYGGSYAGARAAHMKVLYSDLVFGAIASSGVTHASVELWEYMDVIRRYADKSCSAHLVNFAETIDNILQDPSLRKPLKLMFGLAGLSHDYDFIQTIESTLGSWQAKNWDPAIGSTDFDKFCATLDAPLTNLSSVVDYNSIGEKDVQKLLEFPGVNQTLFVYAKYVRDNIVSTCTANQTVEQCFGSFNDTEYQGTSLNDTWRLWTFQVCTQWGYFFTAPPNKELPRIVSKLHTLEAESRICRQAFPPGQYFTVPFLPNVTAVNVLGGFDIAADRLAIIDGEEDPWRPMTPHSSYYAKNRPDTILRPFKLIPHAVHHWDENGLSNMTQEPPDILRIHEETIGFVTSWLKEIDTSSNVNA